MTFDFVLSNNVPDTILVWEDFILENNKRFMGNNNKQLTFPLQLETNCCALKIKSPAALSKAGDYLSKARWLQKLPQLSKKVAQEYPVLYLEQPVWRVNISALFIGAVTLREFASDK